MSALLFLQQCTSTNDAIVPLLTSVSQNFFAIYTLRQTQGRGQYGNQWNAPDDLNIAFTVAVPCDRVALPSHLFNFHTANAVASFLATLTASQTKVKWPNDLIINGKKVVGILMEKKKVAEKKFYIIGIGINVLQRDFSQLPKAGSLLTQTGKHFSPEEVATKLAHFLEVFFENKVSEAEVLHHFNSHLFRKNVVSVFVKNQSRQNGIIKNVDEQGFLWIDLEQDGLQKFNHKEIELLY